MDRGASRTTTVERNGFASAFCLALLFLFAGCASPSASPEEVFKEFEAAWKNSETHKLDALVSESTRQYFAGLQPWLIRGDEESIKNLPLFDQYMILKLRMDLDSFDREDWVNWYRVLESDSESHALSGYLLDMLEDVFHQTTLGTVDTIEGVTAGQLHRLGSTTGLSLRFVNENGWKIELARVFRDAFQQKLDPYLSDDYKNRDRVWEMLKAQYGDRAKRSLSRSRIAND